MIPSVCSVTLQCPVQQEEGRDLPHLGHHSLEFIAKWGSSHDKRHPPLVASLRLQRPMTPSLSPSFQEGPKRQE